MERDYEPDHLAEGFKDKKHNVYNYFDLFTGMFGQPEKPSFTKITVKDDCTLFESYTADNADGDITLYNTLRIVRTKPHTVPSVN